MSRLIITLSDDDKRWLQIYSQQHKQSIAETIREAVRRLRERSSQSDLKLVLRETAGAWGKSDEDSQEAVDRLRSEWDKR